MVRTTKGIQREEILREHEMKYLILFITSLCFGVTNNQNFTEIHGDFTYTEEQEVEAQHRIETVARRIDNVVDLSDWSNRALGSIIGIAVLNLRKNHYYKEADEIEKGWGLIDGRIVDIAKGRRDIGDFEPISEWLALAYEVIELALGYQTCSLLRITDIKTINFGLRVVLNPCKYGPVEFNKHFCGDKYRGLGPVVAYWSVVTSCSIGTFGAGYFFVCSPLGWLIERGVNKVVAPKLSPRIYNRACSI